MIYVAQVFTIAVVTREAPLTTCKVVGVARARGSTNAAECAGVVDLVTNLSSAVRNGVHVLRQRDGGVAAVAIVSWRKHIFHIIIFIRAQSRIDKNT